MGNGCCKPEIEANPDGSIKEPQTKEQYRDDPADLRRWAKDGDSVELERLLKRMPVRSIRSSAKKSEGVPEEEGNTALHFAAARGSLPCVELLVLYGASVNSRGAGGATPLHSALEVGRRQVAQFLLEHGADVNAKNKGGASPFLATLLSGRKRLSLWLLQRCSASLDLAATDCSGLGPCNVAARHGWWDVLEKLIDMVADASVALNTRSSEGETALGWVLKYAASGLLPGPELERLTVLLLQKGASAVVPAFKEQMPPLCLAAATGNVAVISALRERGAVLDPAACVDSVKRNALHYAAAKGHQDLCELLMREAGAALQPHLADAAGNTPLHLAAVRGHADVAKALLERSDDVVKAIMAANHEGISTYHLILQSGPDEKAQRGALWILERIGEEGGKACIMDKERLLETPLLLAVGSHQEMVVAKLLEQGHDPDQANFAGETPLSRCLAGATVQTAAADGAIFKMLVEKGAQLEKASGSSHPLLTICMNPLSRFSEQVVDLLVARAGGDPAALRWSDHADAAGRGPLHLAALYDNAFMVRYLLEQAKIDVDTPSGPGLAPGGPTLGGLTPLMYAAMGCSTNAIRVLLNRRADPRATDLMGRSVLSYCLKLDRPESLACAAMLLVMGAPAEDCVDIRGEGLLHRAVRYGTSEFIRLWVRYGGNVCLRATTDDVANDLPEELGQLLREAGDTMAGAAAAARRMRAEGDYLDRVPQGLEAEEDDTEEDGADGLGSGKLGVEGVDGSDSNAGYYVSDKPVKAGSREGSSRNSRSSGSGRGNRSDPSGDAYGGSGGRGGGSPRSFMKVKSRRSATDRADGEGRDGSGGSFGNDGGGDAEDDESVETDPVDGFDGAASEGALAQNDTGSVGAGPGLASLSVPTGAAYGGSYGTSYGGGGGDGAGWLELGDAGAVAEAVEAVETEVMRYPSFCSRPSPLEVRRWARRGAAWFDDTVPTVAHPELAPDLCPPTLPLPPGEEEELAEEEAIAFDEQHEILPALDADAIWRRMLLSRIKDRRQPKAVASAGAIAATRPPHGPAAGGVAESTMPAAADGMYGVCDGNLGGKRTANFVERVSRRRSVAGVGVYESSSAAPVATAAGGGADGGDVVRRSSASSVPASVGSSSNSWVRASFGRAWNATSGAADHAKSMRLGLQGDANGSGAHGNSGVEEYWMDEIIRSAEAAMAAIKRGAPMGEVSAYGSGSRAVRAVMRNRRSLSPTESPAVSPTAAAAAEARPGAVAEAREDGGGGSSSESDGGSSSEDSDNEGPGADGNLDSAMEDLKSAGIGLASKLLDKSIAIVDPYFKKGTRYKGVPRYMDEELINVKPTTLEELLSLADQLGGRLRRYPAPVDGPQLSGADLRARNIKWYNLGLSPAEYPMKPGQWKPALKKAKAAVQAARARVARKPGDKVVVRSRKAWFGLPAMPSRPELRDTSALVYAVRLCRPSCVAALLSATLQPLNLPDGWGHPPVAYAAYMLARDKHNEQLQQVYDMLLEKLPQVNFTRLDPNDGDAGHSILCPVNLAIISGDRSRLAYLVMRCAGAINNSWTALMDIPAYLGGTWEKVVAKCDSRCPALALAVLSKRIDTVKLVLDLGANPNVFGEARDVRLKAKMAREYEEEQEVERRLRDGYMGVLTKARLSLMQRVTRVKRAITNIDIPGITKPHPFVTPLHLAARTGQAEVVFLLLRRGAFANGGGAVPYAKKTPLQEALMYARSNYSTTNAGAKRMNWLAVRPSLEDIPPMSDAAAKKESESRAKAMMKAMVDPTVMALKAVALAAKYAVNFLLEMRKRPIAHWDPALWPAHVLLLYRAPYDLSDVQTSILLRDLMDNGKWKWLRRPAGRRFRVRDRLWTEGARGAIDTIKADRDVGYPAMKATPEPKEYKALKQRFVAKADEAYFGTGSKAMLQRYQKCANTLMEAQKQYVFNMLQPALLEAAEKAISLHVEGSAALLEVLASERQKALEASASSLELGVALDETGVMDWKPYERFSLPRTALPADISADVAAAVQAATAAALRSQAARAAKGESWGRVMVWGPGGGVFQGIPGDEELAPLPGGEEELRKLGKVLMSVNTDKLKESLENLQEQMGAAADSLLAKMQDAQEGLCNLLEVIGIDFMDVL